MSLPLLVSPAITKMLTAAIAVILLAANFTTINAQQQVQSEGGLTATLNGNSFTQGDTITVSGSVGERGPNSFVGIRVIDPRSEEVEDGFPAIAADNTFTYSFVAGEQGEFDLDDPMVTSGNYRTVVTYSPPSDNSVIEEVELVFEYSPTPDAAEPQGALTTDQLAAIQNGTAETRTFQSKNDSFRLQVSDGWVIQDVNNSGSALGIEGTQGYGILAQLCPEEEPQQQGATSAALTTNASDSTNNNSSDNNNSCQGAQQEVIHIIRYPGLETRIQQEANNVTIYHLQKLQEVGYSRIQIVNSTATTVNITDPQTNQSIATVPAKIVEMTYSTSSDPNETRLGYFILTSTRATLPNLGTIKGYAVFYEGNTTTTTTTTTNSNTTATATPGITTTTTAAASSDSSAIPPPTPLPPVVEQVFDSFELIAAPEVAQAIAQQAAAAEAAALGEGGDEDNDDDDDDTGGGDEGGDGDDDDDGADEDEGDGGGEGDDDTGGGGEEGGGGGGEEEGGGEEGEET
jgi:hypothetical protein